MLLKISSICHCYTESPLVYICSIFIQVKELKGFIYSVLGNSFIEVILYFWQRGEFFRSALLLLGGLISFILYSERTKTQCEDIRERLLGQTSFNPRGPRPVGQFIPECDENGDYRPVQCFGSTGQCWCVDRNGQEIPGTRTDDGSQPYCK